MEAAALKSDCVGCVRRTYVRCCCDDKITTETAGFTHTQKKERKEKKEKEKKEKKEKEKKERKKKERKQVAKILLVTTYKES